MRYAVGKWRFPLRAKWGSYYKDCNILLGEYRAIYFFLPKVACSSLKHFMAKLLDLDPSSDVHDLPFPSVPKPLLRSPLYADFYKFVIVRNPWDRLVSCYCNKIGPPEVTNQSLEKGVAREFLRSGFRGKGNFWGGMSFSDFVDSVSRIDDRHAESHFRSQSFGLDDMIRTGRMNYVGRFENLERDFREICAEGGIPHRALARHNVSTKKGHYTEYYTRETWDVVKERYSADIELFGYETENPHL